MKTIHLAPALSFPAAELATLVVSLLGNRGSGKSNAAFVLIEGLLSAEVPVIVLDYVGIYWSLRLDESGKHPSPFQIPVLGGTHGDITLVPSTGAVVADALARSHASAVLDVSHMSKGDRGRFATDFAETFFRTKKNYPGPVQIWLEESQRFVPQKLFTGQERMLGAFEEIAEVGRNYGIGLGLISQRPQKINKDVLNLSDVMIALRMNGVLERKAIAEWVQEKDADGRDAVKDELPGLERGQAIVWSPSVFNTYGTFRLKKRSTYDVNATPLSVRKAVKIKSLDLAELESAMGSAVEEAKANDPRVLKARIVELEKQIANGAVTRGYATNGATRQDLKVVAEIKKQVDRSEKAIAKLEVAQEHFKETCLAKLDFARDRLAQAQQVVTSEMGGLRALIKQNGATMVISSNGATKASSPRFHDPGRGPRQAQVIAGADSGTTLSRCARAILCVLAVRGTATDSQISALSGYRKTSSSFANGLSELRTQGLIDGTPDRRTITESGHNVAGPQEPLPTGPALLGYWTSRLSRAEATMLEVVFHERTVSREKLSAQSGYSITSSSFANALSGLRTLDLIEGSPGGDVSIARVFLE